MKPRNRWTPLMARLGPALLSLPLLVTAAAPYNVLGAPLPNLPEWPCRVLRGPGLRAGDERRFLPIQWNGRTNLLAIRDVHGISKQERGRVSVYSWGRTSFRRVWQGKLPTTDRGFVRPTAGDIDGSGRDEVYTLDEINRLAVHWLGERRRIAEPIARIPCLVKSFEVSDVRRPGRPDLLVAVSRQTPVDTHGDADLLIAYSRTRGRWRRSGSWRIHAQSFSLGLISGDWDRRPGTELLLKHWPSEIDESAYELWGRRGGRLVPLRLCEDGPFPPGGTRDWVGISTGLIRGRRIIVSRTRYLTTDVQHSDQTDRGELLEWAGRRPRKLYRLPGLPVAVGAFRGSGRSGVLIETAEGKYRLLEPRNLYDAKDREAGRAGTPRLDGNARGACSLPGEEWRGVIANQQATPDA